MSGYPDEDPDAAPPRRRADLSLPRKVTMDPMQYYGRCELQAARSKCSGSPPPGASAWRMTSTRGARGARSVTTDRLGYISEVVPKRTQTP